MKYYKFLRELKEHSTTLLFLGGFAFDMMLLPDATHTLTRYIGLGYLCSVGLFIMWRELLVSRNRANSFEAKMYSFLTFLIAYFLGSALSFVCVYSFRSADLGVSWPFFIILFLCIFANEFVSTHNFRLTLDIAVLFIATLFFIIFNTPLILKVQNDMTFGVSIMVTIVISIMYIYVLRITSETAEREAPRATALAIGIPMFVGMLYILNVIPAVPLSLGGAGVYHNITHNDDRGFILFGEEKSRFAWIKDSVYTPVHYVLPTDDAVYFYSAVNAPAELTAPLSHVWEYYDEGSKKWVVSTTISFGLTGGRENGYRAYSKKENIIDGLWRVTIMVDANRVVGRRTFRVLHGVNSSPLQTITA
jgi:hypothetical protein